MQVSHGSGGMTPTRQRFLIMALLFVTVVINYLDRSNLSIAAPALPASSD
jgi:MFS transporter, ACS family, D-galactonate transporter